MFDRLRSTIRSVFQGPVTRVTIHHEGAGSPTDNVGRFAEGGYSAGIGINAWTRFRSPYVSYGTLGWNHRSVDICLSGNRMDYVVTDHDLELIREACADFRARGELVDNPDVVFHHDSPGSNTVCPGTHTYERQAEVVAACKPAPPVPPPPKKKVTKLLFFFRVPDAATAEGRADVYVSDGIYFQRTTPDQLKALQVFATQQGLSTAIGTMTKAQLGNMQRVGP